MTLQLAIPRALHLLASSLWIGGIFFSHFAVRPALRERLDGQARIRIAISIFERFFPWVWVAIVALWVSGIWIGILEARHQVALHVHIMAGIALIMTLIFAYLYAVPFQAMRIAVTHYENWRLAGAKLMVVRRWMLVNLVLGVLTVLDAVVGPQILLGVPGAAN
jgi:uncharacterized membrane protein